MAISALVFKNCSCGPAWGPGMRSLLASMRRRRISCCTGIRSSKSGENSLDTINELKFFVRHLRQQRGHIREQRLAVLAGHFQALRPALLFALGLQQEADGAEVGLHFRA